MVVMAALLLTAIAAPSMTVASEGVDVPVVNCEVAYHDTDCVTPAAEDSSEEAPSEETRSDETPSGEIPSGEPPTGEPHSTPAPTDGEVVYDGPFLTPTPDPTPAGEVLDATGAPAMTPPNTDTTDGRTSSVAGAGLPPLLMVVAGFSLMALLAGRVPPARRS
jgi:hypothetical protein